MHHELLQKIHSNGYQSTMNFDDYLSEVSLGLQLLKHSGIDAKDVHPKAVNLALEYNMELMVEELLK